MRFIMGEELVAVTKARGDGDSLIIYFRILKAIGEIPDEATVVAVGEDGLSAEISGKDYKEFADWAFYLGCPRFCPNPSLAA